jgi:hypothetical protein
MRAQAGSSVPPLGSSPPARNVPSRAQPLARLRLQLDREVRSPHQVASRPDRPRTRSAGVPERSRSTAGGTGRRGQRRCRRRRPGSYRFARHEAPPSVRPSRTPTPRGSSGSTTPPLPTVPSPPQPITKHPATTERRTLFTLVMFQPPDAQDTRPGGERPGRPTGRCRKLPLTSSSSTDFLPPACFLAQGRAYTDARVTRPPRVRPQRGTSG